MAAGQATATCFCGSVQIKFSTSPEAILGTFTCHCIDCKKISASMFASGFIISDTSLDHIRGEDSLSEYKRSEGVDSGSTVTNHFCGVCGTLMYRRSSGFPGVTVARIGTVDDAEVRDTLLKPAVEQFTRERAGWLHAALGAEQQEGNYFTGKSSG